MTDDREASDLRALSCAGPLVAMGYTIAVTVPDREHGSRVTRWSCDKHGALFAARTEYGATDARVYQRRAGHWRRVRS